MQDQTTSRRLLVKVMVGLMLSTAVARVPMAYAAKESSRHPAVKYMKKVARDLIAAQRTGTISSFSAAIRQHADVPEIANYSLGRYRGKLRKSKRGAYYRGVRRFMARYFADQSKRYRVVKADISSNVTESSGAILVNTTVRLKSGATHNITWRLVKRRGSYRITDVKVFGFSLTFLQRGIFYRFLSKRNGDVNALVVALNR